MSAAVAFSISYDKSTWVNLEPAAEDVQTWALGLLTERWQRVGREPTAPEWDGSMADLLAANTIAGDLPGMVYAYWPSFADSADPLALLMDTWPLTDGSFAQLAEVAGVADEANIDIGTATVLRTRSGDAVKVLSYSAMEPDAADSPVAWVVTYAWCLPTLEGSVVLTASGMNMERMPVVIEALDELAAGLYVTRDGEPLVATPLPQA